VNDRGAALIDLIAASALGLILTGISVPVIGGTLDRERTISGARFLAGQLQRARLDSLKRARAVALRIEVIDDEMTMRLYGDGNGNGVLQRDIERGIDLPFAPAQRLDHEVPGVALRINQPIVDIGTGATLQPGDDPLRIGNSALVTFSPTGSSTSGTLYVAARRGPQMAVRVFGATGRIRVLMFDARMRQWRP